MNIFKHKVLLGVIGVCIAVISFLLGFLFAKDMLGEENDQVLIQCKQ
jgi:uncharacterized phage infection (PIP) family protein YhgE